MSAEPLEFARGIRFPRADEIPGPVDDALARIASARVTTGYTRKDVEGKPYSSAIEANVHASQLWNVFQDLVIGLLPSPAAVIVGVKEDEPVFGPYTTRDAALNLLEPYKEPLQHDGFLEFGIIHSHDGRTEEVFVRSVKYIQIWTNSPDKAIALLEKHGISHVPDLQFVDEFPRVSQALPFGGQTSGWFAVMEGVQAGFAGLPDPELESS